MEYNTFQKKFLQSLADIQEDKVQIALSKYKEAMLFMIVFNFVGGNSDVVR